MPQKPTEPRGRLSSLRFLPGIAARDIRRYAQSMINSPSRRGNIAMLHAGRCGSSVLADLLNQHPSVRWCNEPFEGMGAFYRAMPSRNRAFHLLGNLLYAHKSDYFGFDSKYLPEQHLSPNCADKTPEEYVTLLERLGFNYFLLLNRENHLRRAVSIAIGQKTGLWNSESGYRGETLVDLNPEHFISYGKTMTLLDFFRSLDDVYTRLQTRLAGLNVLELSYERDIQSNPEIAYQKTCAFIGLAPAPVNVRLKKMNPQPIRELVGNYNAVAEALRGSPYEWMLEH